MRLLKIGVYYPEYLRQFYAQRPQLAAAPYAAQHAALMQDCFGSADFWTRALQQHGYETCDLVANAEPLQKRWAHEHGAAYVEASVVDASGDAASGNAAASRDNASWLFDITAAQVRAFRPEALIVADYSTLTPAFLARLRRENPALRLILGWCGAPYGDAAIFREWDIVLSCVPELVEQFRREGHLCRHVNHAFEPRILERIDTRRAPSVDFAFIGSVLKFRQFHEERERLLSELVRRTDLQIWSEVKRAPARERRRTAARRLAYDGVAAASRIGVPRALLDAAPLIGRVARWESRPALSAYVDERIARRARPPIYGLRMFQQLRDSRVALNTHIDISHRSASNMRLFEATGVGACLLTDWRENLPQLFAPDTEVVAYRNTAECVEKVRYLLAHEDERRAIAAAGQRRTLREHTCAHRAAQIDEIIREWLSKNG